MTTTAFRPGFRHVALPPEVPGILFLHSLPGRYELWADALMELRQHHVTRIVCLMPEREVLEKSAPYAKAASANALPCARTVFPIRDYDVPADPEAFFALADETSAQLRAGERILTHCAAGHGRTGMFAMCVMIALGLSRREAVRVVARAASKPENAAQRKVVAAMARRTGRGSLSKFGRALRALRGQGP